MHRILTFVWSLLAVLCWTSLTHGDDAFMVLKGHKRQVTWVDFSPDGKTLVSGCRDGTIRFWELESGKVIDTIDDSPNHVDRVAYCCDGNAIVTSETLTKRENFGYVIKIWDIKNQKTVSSINAPHGGAFAVSPNGKVLATPSDQPDGKDVVLWNTKDGRQIKTIGPIENTVSALAFTSDNASLAIGTDHGSIEVWDVEKAKQSSSFLTNKDEAIVTLAFSVDGKSLAIAAFCKPVALRSVKDGQLLKKLEANFDSLGNLLYSPDGKILAVPLNKPLGIFSATSGKQLATLSGHTSGIECLAISPNGKWLATAGGFDKTVRIWEMPKTDK